MSNIGGNQHNPNRLANDNYPTDPAWTRALVRNVRLPGPIWEPACGEMAMADELRQVASVIETDITTGTDFLTAPLPDGVKSIVTNPPYRLANEFIQAGLGHDPVVLALLVGIHFLGGVDRTDRIYGPAPPAKVIVIPERMKVHGNSSQFNHCWLVWDARANGPTELIWEHAR